MRTVELWLGKYDREWTLFNVLSIEFEINPKVYTLDKLEVFLRSNGGYFVNIRYWDSLYGNAATAFSDVLHLFEQIKSELGNTHLDFAFIPHDEVTLDFTKCRSIFAVYQEMREKMEWQDWYGNNLDALWDILTGLPYKGDDFVILRPRHYCDIPYGQDAAFTNAVDKICDIFLEAQNEYEKIKVEIRFSEPLLSHPGHPVSSYG